MVLEKFLERSGGGTVDFGIALNASEISGRPPLHHHLVGIIWLGRGSVHAREVGGPGVEPFRQPEFNLQTPWPNGLHGFGDHLILPSTPRAHYDCVVGWRVRQSLLVGLVSCLDFSPDDVEVGLHVAEKQHPHFGAARGG
jgi:hypothetical protein